MQALIVTLLEEQVLALQLADQRGGIGAAAEAGGELGIAGVDHGQTFEEAPHRHRQGAQYVLFEELGDQGIEPLRQHLARRG